VFSLPKRPDSIAYVAVAPLGADYRDSIQIGKVGIAGDVFIVPGGRWMIVETTQRGALLRHQYRAVDRLGRPRDSVEVPTGWWWEVSGPTAFWIQNWTRPFSIIRLPFDTATGHFSGPGDTVLLSSTGGFDASEDAGALVYADGTTAYGLWALDLPDAFKGQFASSRGLRSGTEPIKCQLSPDGSRLLLLETVARGGREGRDVVLLPFQGGPPLAHWLMDSLLDESSVHWMPDGLSFSYAARTSGGVQLVTVDVRSGLRHVAAAIADS